MNVLCSATPCPLLLSTNCVFYYGANLVYTGIATNDNMTTILEKLDTTIGTFVTATGTVTSVNAIGSTGISITGGPITSSGTFIVTNTAPDQTVVLTEGTGIDITGAYPNFTITNSLPDQTVVLTQGSGITITGTYPSFTISAAAGTGTVTSIGTTSPITGGTITTTGTIGITQSGAASDGYLSSGDWNIFNNKQSAGNYITALTGEATASGPGSVAITLTNSAVIGKVLTGLNVIGSAIVATDTILEAFGKAQNQINALVGGLNYQGVWNASTNTPTLTSSVGTKGYYYKVSVAGNTNLNGITDWEIGDLAIFNGTVWDQIDNTDSVSSVNGYTGAVSLTTDDVPEGAVNLYYTNARARAAVSLTTTGTSGAATYNSTTGVFNIPQYADASGGSGYIQNQIASTQTAGFKISGDGTLANLTVGKNINLSTTSTTGGIIYQNSETLLHTYTGDPSYNTQNLFVGLRAGNFTNTLYNNTGIGTDSLKSLTSGSGNTAVGLHSGQNITTGQSNVLIGADAAGFLTTGSSNIVIGGSSGFNLTTGSGNILIGASIPGSGALTNNIIIASGGGIKAQHDGTDWTFNSAAPTFTGMASGIVKSTAGVLSIATAGTDYLAPTGDGSSLTNVVHISGTETVTGQKTFSANQTIFTGTSTTINSLGNAYSYVKRASTSYEGQFIFSTTGASGAGSYWTMGFQNGNNNFTIRNETLSVLTINSATNYLTHIGGISIQNASAFLADVTINGQITQGGAITPGVANYQLLTLGGNTTTHSYYSRPTISSGATTFHYGFRSAPITQTASFTLNNLLHFSADSPILGVGSSVGTQIGFLATDLSSATNNYGFYGGLNSGANKYNLYMIGTAPNYLAGALIVGGALTGTSATFSGDVTVDAPTSARLKLDRNSNVNYSHLEFATSGTTDVYMGMWNSDTWAIRDAVSLANFISYSTTTGNITLGGALTGTSATFTGSLAAGNATFTGSQGISITPTSTTPSSAGAHKLEVSRTSDGTFLRIGNSSGVSSAVLRGYSSDYQLTLADGGIEAAGNVLVNNVTDANGRTFLNTITESTSATGIAGVAAGNGTASGDNIYMYAFGKNYTTSGGFVQDGGAISSETALSGGLSIITRANAPMRFYTNGHTNERMRITEGGFFKASNDGTYVGISGSYHELRSNSTGAMITYFTNTSANPYGIIVAHPNATMNNATNYFYSATEGGTPRFYVYTNGGISNYSANNVNLSDENVKKEIVEMDSQWDTIKNFPYRKFKYDDQTHDDWNYGTGARALHKIAPHLVDTDSEDGKWRVYDTDIFYTQGKALQEALIRIEEQDNNIKMLENKLNEILSKL